MSHTSENASESESSPHTSDIESEEESGNSEYHSGEESEPDRTQIILVNREEEFTFLHIRFPMPLPYPKPYIQLKELMETVDTPSETYDRITNISGNPHKALGYILYHFNIDRISRSIRAYRPYNLDQVYYSTFVEPSQYKTLLKYYDLTRKRLQDALAKERLEIQKLYGRYLVPDELPITLMDCFI